MTSDQAEGHDPSGGRALDRAANGDVLGTILDWSAGLPDWQRDTLRRLVQQGSLAADDIDELSELCKRKHGLSAEENLRAMPLEAAHIRQPTTGDKRIGLVSLTHHSGVNALATDQTVKFHPQLTVVYGANAAGKSGYTRILKRACHARGSENILGNVLASAPPGRPSATVRFGIDGVEQDLRWSDQGTHSALGQISVFDAQSASVYVTEQTDVAFRPLGLDLFDKLASACGAVRARLEREQRTLSRRQPSLPRFREGTAVNQVVANLTSLTSPESVKRLAGITEAERNRKAEIARHLADRASTDPGKLAKSLRLRSRRLSGLVQSLETTQEELSADSLTKLAATEVKLSDLRTAAQALATTAFPPDLLPGTGSASWRVLWDAAQRFSEDHAYPEHKFPATEHDEARCVLCQQGLSAMASDRLQRFASFLESDLQAGADAASLEIAVNRARLENLVLGGDELNNLVTELDVDRPRLAAELQRALDESGATRDQVLEALGRGDLATSDVKGFTALPVAGLAAEVEALENRIRELEKPTGPQPTTDALTAELAELEARQQLQTALPDVLDEIERQQRLGAYRSCLGDTSTNSITLKSTEVTKKAVTQQLAEAFRNELEQLAFSHTEVEIEPSGGRKGALYHRLVLKRSPATQLGKVLSEGEARVLAIAAFFAELSTADDESAILFDDPVSSLDHNWRDQVARRLVAEAQHRQVIVFTHDIVFVLALTETADSLEVPYQHQHIRLDALGAGVSTPDLPWAAMKVKSRIGWLRNELQKAEKLYRTDSASYEQHAVLIYGRLREAWERGVEEVLLGGVVERYRRGVQTQTARQLLDITEDDCRTLDSGMTKCSRWLAGHDQAAAENPPVPGPDELKKDIEAFTAWVDRIRKRRR